jgi:DUF2934 family protein
MAAICAVYAEGALAAIPGFRLFRNSAILRRTARMLAPNLRRILSMAETVKKSSAKPKAPAKPRKTAATKDEANGAVPSVTEMKLSHEQVAQLAHRFWSDRGRLDGHHEEDWFRAEHELRARAS